MIKLREMRPLVCKAARSFSVVVTGSATLDGLNKGCQLLGRTVELTLGPAGRTVVVDPFEKSNYNALSAYP